MNLQKFFLGCIASVHMQESWGKELLSWFLLINVIEVLEYREEREETHKLLGAQSEDYV